MIHQRPAAGTGWGGSVRAHLTSGTEQRPSCSHADTLAARPSIPPGDGGGPARCADRTHPSAQLHSTSHDRGDALAYGAEARRRQAAGISSAHRCFTFPDLAPPAPRRPRRGRRPLLPAPRVRLSGDREGDPAQPARWETTWGIDHHTAGREEPVSVGGAVVHPQGRGSIPHAGARTLPDEGAHP